MKPPTKRLKPQTEAPVMLSVWVPLSMIQSLDAAAKQQDTDRSKLVRRAIRTTLQAS